ncbi:hypothetical protein NUW54_g1653 [Trametes sanguinea]|uniref:Uncharacterized protein n=1 Tax=Trametes sanguinea TaxID=158606 RepID=A0ACC1Q8X0_9APHY|nr:hypothetical protein NUW54_g1653 [Trametes sanguinea]
MKHLFSLILLAGLAAPVVTAYDVFGPLKPAQVGTSYTVEFNLTALAPVLNGNTNSTFSTASCSASVSSASTAATSTSASVKRAFTIHRRNTNLTSSARASSAVDHNGCRFHPHPHPRHDHRPRRGHSDRYRGNQSKLQHISAYRYGCSQQHHHKQRSEHELRGRIYSQPGHVWTGGTGLLSHRNARELHHRKQRHTGLQHPAAVQGKLHRQYVHVACTLRTSHCRGRRLGSSSDKYSRRGRASLIPVVRLRIDDTELLLALALLTTWVVIAFLISQHQEAPQKPPEKTYGVVEVPHTQHSATPAEGL